jgi:hypothetical protein
MDEKRGAGESEDERERRGRNATGMTMQAAKLGVKPHGAAGTGLQPRLRSAEYIVHSIPQCFSRMT